MCIKHEPGFQIGLDVPTEVCLRVLEQLMRERLGLRRFSFNHILDGIGEEDYGAHINTYAENNAGITLHESLEDDEEDGEDTGEVRLQLARFGVTSYDSSFHNVPPPVEGPVYTGRLAPRVKTVFSEGLVSAGGLLVVRMGPTIHDFESDKGRQRRWRAHIHDNQRP